MSSKQLILEQVEVLRLLVEALSDAPLPPVGPQPIPQAFYNDLVDMDKAFVSLPAGEYTLPQPIVVQRSNVTVDLTGSTFIVDGYPRGTGSYEPIQISSTVDPYPGHVLRNYSRVSGQVTGGVTDSLTLTEPSDIQPGEQVKLLLGVNLTDPAEPCDVVSATVQSVNGNTITFTEPLPRTIPIYANVDAIKALVPEAYWYKIGEPWGEPAPGNANILRGLGLDHGLLRFVGGQITSNVTLKGLSLVMPEPLAHIDQLPNGSNLVSVTDTSHVIIENLSVVHCVGNVLHCWRSDDLVVNGLNVSGVGYAKVWNTKIQAANVISIWSGYRLEFNDVVVSGNNWQLVAIEVSPTDVTFNRVDIQLGLFSGLTYISPPHIIGNWSGVGGTGLTVNDMTLPVLPPPALLKSGTVKFYRCIGPDGPIPEPPLPPPTGVVIPGLVELWTLGEANGTRMGSKSVGPAINPSRIDLLDPNNTPSAPGLGGALAAYFPYPAGLKTQPSNTAGNPLGSAFMQGSGSFSAGAWVYWNGTPPNGGTLFRHAGDTWRVYVKQVFDGTYRQALSISSRDARTGTFREAVSSGNLQAGRWYFVMAGFDHQSGKLFTVVVNDTGMLTRTESSAVGRRQPVSSSQMLVGGGSFDSMQGRMQSALFCKAALSDSQILSLWNGGTPLPYSEIVSPTYVPPSVPFNNLQLVQANFATTAGIGGNGLYWLRPYPLHEWHPSLSASLGNYVWARSSDHGEGGVWIGFSASPATLPNAWTKIIEGSGVIQGRTYSGLETPHLEYVSNDPNGRPFYCYVHGSESSGFPSGLGSSQETYLWSAATPAGPWIKDQIVIATEGWPPGPAYNHTGYMTLAKNLPGQTGYHAYHLGVDHSGASFCTPSNDPRLFDAGADPEELDNSSAFPAGYNQIGWFGNVFSPDGSNVYGLGRGFFPERRGVCLAELSLENGAWRLPTGKVWELVQATEPWPHLGYIQDVRGYYEPSTRILHMYVLRGYYPNSEDERVDYWTMVF